METLNFNLYNELLTTPEQVIADFCRAYTPEEAQDKLWEWVHPMLLACYREQKPERLNQLVAFYERLERLVFVVYAVKEINETGTTGFTQNGCIRRG